MLRDSSISYVQQKKNWAVGYKRERTDLRLKKHVCKNIATFVSFVYLAPLVIFVTKGRMALPNRMNFRKNSKRLSTPPHLIFGKLCCNFLQWIWSNICKEVRGPDSMKSMHMISRDREHSEGLTVVWNLSENSCVLVP